MGVQWHRYIWPGVTLKGHSQGHQDFKAFNPVKEPS